MCAGTGGPGMGVVARHGVSPGRQCPSWAGGSGATGLGGVLAGHRAGCAGCSAGVAAAAWPAGAGTSGLLLARLPRRTRSMRSGRSSPFRAVLQADDPDQRCGQRLVVGDGGVQPGQVSVDEAHLGRAFAGHLRERQVGADRDVPGHCAARCAPRRPGARTEQEFFSRLAEAGVAVRQRYSTTNAGYAVGLPWRRRAIRGASSRGR